MDKQIAMLSRALCADLNTPVSLGVYLRMKYGLWADLVAMRVDPRNYLDSSIGASRYYRDVQAVDFLRKFPGLPTGINLREVAEAEFYRCEKLCSATNQRLLPFIWNYFPSGDSSYALWPFLAGVKKRVALILGRLPDDLVPRFGPGNVFESKGFSRSRRRGLTIADKTSSAPTFTDSASPLQCMIYRTAWGRAVLSSSAPVPQTVRGNRFTTVPKDSTKDRGICIEPSGNLSLQLAVGQEIRRRLARHGIDLRTGQDRHRALACDASINDRLASLDLSSASDTIARNLVRLLLPEDWFELLDSLRSPATLVRGRWHRLEKFSSMGNGFTFELESLLFYAITSEACGSAQDVSVYGDDILYPSCHAREVHAALRFFGFTPNERKSFHQGGFRESCGGDFLCGFNVRPYQADTEPASPAQWISIVNGLDRSARRGLPLFRVKALAISQVPAASRLYGPEELGDLVIRAPLRRWHIRVVDSIRYVRVWRPLPKRLFLDSFHPDVILATVLYGAAEGDGARGGAGFVVPRGTISSYAAGWVPFS